MTLSEYKDEIIKRNFEEYPYAVNFYKPLDAFINFSEADLDLRVYLCKLILSINFSAVGGYQVYPRDLDWFLNGFRASFHEDYAKPWLAGTVKRAIEQIMEGNVFTDGIIATTFMFTVIEFYAKYILGYRPWEYNPSDPEQHAYIKAYYPPDKSVPKRLYLTTAFNCLQERASHFQISIWLNETDYQTGQLLLRYHSDLNAIKNYKVADRLREGRNTMLHGTQHSSYNMGKYLLMLYSLFHYQQEVIREK